MQPSTSNKVSSDAGEVRLSAEVAADQDPSMMLEAVIDLAAPVTYLLNGIDHILGHRDCFYFEVSGIWHWNVRSSDPLNWCVQVVEGLTLVDGRAELGTNPTGRPTLQHDAHMSSIAAANRTASQDDIEVTMGEWMSQKDRPSSISHLLHCHKSISLHDRLYDCLAIQRPQRANVNYLHINCRLYQAFTFFKHVPLCTRKQAA